MVTSLQAGYLRLFRRNSLPHASFAKVIRHFGGLRALAGATEKAMMELGLEPGEIDQLCSGSAGRGNSSQLERADAWLAAGADRHLICYEEQRYPPLLRETASPPPLLFVVGNPAAILNLQVAMVGSRKASHNGQQTAFWLAQALAQAGFTVCSGLAAGIDSQAHRGALEDAGTTVAVLGTGVDQIYPASNRRLASRITEQGALVSELPLGSPPTAKHFPQRNRIIAGLSVGVVVVEAALRSGSLITARLAMEENREVFAVPGSIHSANARGCHRLIREGAKLVDCAESIIEELPTLMLAGAERLAEQGNAPGKASQTGIGASTRLSEAEHRLLGMIGFEPSTPDSLVKRSGLPISEVNRLLASLELKGLLELEAGRYKCLSNGLQPPIY